MDLDGFGLFSFQTGCGLHFMDGARVVLLEALCGIVYSTFWRTAGSLLVCILLKHRYTAEDLTRLLMMDGRVVASFPFLDCF